MKVISCLPATMQAGSARGEEGGEKEERGRGERKRRE